MKKIILALAAILLTVSVASAQVAVPQIATPQAPNPQESLAAKKADVEAKLKARQDATLQRIDEKIAKARAELDKLEQEKANEDVKKKIGELVAACLDTAKLNKALKVLSEK